MPAGTIALIVVGVLIFFGLAHRVLDRMRLNDRQALLFIGLAVAGSFVDLTLWRGPQELVINLGGGLVPLALAVWLIATADSGVERARASVGAVASGGVLYGLGKALPRLPQTLPFEPLYGFAIIAGLIAYVLGRSRRGAFAGAILGVTLADLASWVELMVTRTAGRAWLGGAGMLDATVLSGLIAVLAAELVGETAELAGGGPRATRLRARAEGRAMDLTPRGPDARRTRAPAPAPRGAARRGEWHGAPGRPEVGDIDKIELEEPAQAEPKRPEATDADRSRQSGERGDEPDGL